MKWSILVVLAVAQFLMVLDQAVMNVAISQLVADFDTTVTTIQTVIALYALVMAALMVTGAKLGDIWGREKGLRDRPRDLRIGIGAHGGLVECPDADAGLVGPRGDRGGDGAAGPRRPRGRQLRRISEGDCVWSARGRRRSGDRGWADSRRVGDHRAHMARRLRRRGGGRGADPLRDQVPARARERGESAPAGLGRLGPGRSRYGDGGHRRPAGEQLGLAAAAQLTSRALRLLADALRHRGRPARPRRVSGLGAPSRAAGIRSTRPLPLVRDHQVPWRPFDAAGSEPDLDGGLLHGAALSPSRTGARRARDRRSNAARFGRALHCRARRLSAFVALRAPPARARRACRHVPFDV